MAIKGKRELVLEKFAKDMKWTKGAELGVWKGRTFKHLLNAVSDLHLIGVDLYAPQPDSNGPEKWLPGENGHEWDHETYFTELSKFCEETGGRGAILRMTTTQAASLIDDESLNFIFIDADHSYEGCNRDIHDWSPKVKKGGYIIGHDIDWDEVNRAIRNNFGDDFHEEADNIWWHQKK
jgi:hypothetical protein